ncbi:MAG: hypothetical protein JWM11_6831, partial [Planctomycetaceae bacterium]|nr:hypothetical protein [Planctomycetaceae bacterium]
MRFAALHRIFDQCEHAARDAPECAASGVCFGHAEMLTSRLDERIQGTIDTDATSY